MDNFLAADWQLFDQIHEHVAFLRNATVGGTWGENLRGSVALAGYRPYADTTFNVFKLSQGRLHIDREFIAIDIRRGGVDKEDGPRRK